MSDGQTNQNMDTNTILAAISNMKIELTQTITKNINAHIDHKFNLLNENSNQLQAKVEKHDADIKQIKREERKKNLVIYGFEETEKSYRELENNITSFLNTKMNLELNVNDIDFVRRLGKAMNNKTRPILLTLIYYKKKIEILSNKKCLSNTNVAITEDFPPEVLEIRKHLIPIMQELRREGKHAYIKYDTLIVNGEPYQVGNVDPESGTSSDILELKKRPLEKNSPEKQALKLLKKPRGRPASKDRVSTAKVKGSPSSSRSSSRSISQSSNLTQNTASNSNKAHVDTSQNSTTNA